jgi:hypothetical protein
MIAITTTAMAMLRFRLWWPPASGSGATWMSGGEAFPGVSRSGCRCAIKLLLPARYDWRAEMPKRMQFRH